MELERKINEFDQILKVITAHRDLSSEPLIEAGAVILQEVGKDRRAEILRDLRFNNRMVNSDAATEKQKSALRRFGIEFSGGITKQEASGLLSEAIENRNKRNDNGISSSRLEVVSGY